MKLRNHNFAIHCFDVPGFWGLKTTRTLFRFTWSACPKQALSQGLYSTYSLCMAFRSFESVGILCLRGRCRFQHPCTTVIKPRPLAYVWDFRSRRRLVPLFSLEAGNPDAALPIGCLKLCLKSSRQKSRPSELWKPSTADAKVSRGWPVHTGAGRISTVRHISATGILGGGTDLDLHCGAELREPRTPTGHDAGISKDIFKNIQLRVHQTSETIVEYLFVSPA